MDWTNTLKNIKDIEFNCLCLLFLFEIIIITLGVLWVLIGISLGLYVLYILDGSFVDSLSVFNPCILVSVFHIIPGAIIHIVLLNYFQEYEK